MKKTLLSVATVTALTGIASHNISAAEYTVESGDTLWSLANESGTSVSTLKEVNELSGDLIVPGDVLEVDAEPSEEDAQENDGTYVIKSGDTLFEIGQKFDVDYQKIMEWNNLSTDVIYAGKTLIVAASAAPANETVEEAPAVQEAPAVEEAPAVQEAPAVEEEQAEVVEEAPAVEETEQDQPSAPAAAQNDNQAAEQRAAEERAAEQAAAEERAAEQAAAEQRAAEQAAAEQRAAEQAEAERQERIQQREAEQAEAQEQQSQQAQQAQTQQVSTGGGNAESVARSVAAGKSYVYGGNTASVVDCSALTQQFMQAYKGKSIPRTAAAQMAAGTQVSNPQPGDLVFFNGGSHVGIYIGNGQMIDALNPSEGVGERSVSYVNGTIDGYFRY
ncbi:LysM peptidoglycan-binding domain-containing protein [Salinicoccus roseus]|uniref:LysM peptidoglycan-binding domain-containing protein n=1 Tax=Salinicoccus roseus TaxID=45670 RepID=A0ABT4YG00_9STAP|nr:LysM peptidoglycan-binding domain-containing protein [Salinicoccus roseus]MDB0579740.1 LysM peptidoglycan-binding domain-containing protein [Salinicoccus roseus]